MSRSPGVLGALRGCAAVVRNAADDGAFFVHNTCEAGGRDECEALRESCLLVLGKRWAAFVSIYEPSGGLGLRHLERQIGLDERLVMELTAADEEDGLSRALAKRCARAYVFSVLGDCRALIAKAAAEESRGRTL